MTFLNKIIDSEDAAKKTIKEAEVSAHKKITDAEVVLKKEGKIHTEKLAKNREQALEGQHKELKMLHDSIVKKGEKQAESIKEIASGNVANAVEQVLAAFKNKN